METINRLSRFLDAQQKNYALALQEMNSGKTHGRWMWYMFPTIHDRFEPSKICLKYAIQSREEAKRYLSHPILGKRLKEMAELINQWSSEEITRSLPKTDRQKIKACMTLFGLLPNTDPVFQKVLDHFYDGEQDELTIAILHPLQKIKTTNLV